MSGKIVPDYRELAKILATERAKGRSVALTNGCFDLLHVGHTRLIGDARQLADVLVIATNSDASVRLNKGEGRPYVPLAERMEVLAALSGVDLVTSFPEPTAAALLDGDAAANSHHTHHHAHTTTTHTPIPYHKCCH